MTDRHKTLHTFVDLSYLEKGSKHSHLQSVYGVISNRTGNGSPLPRVFLYNEAIASGGRANVLKVYILYKHQAKVFYCWRSGRKLPPNTNKDIRLSLAVMRRLGINAKKIPLQGLGIYGFPSTKVRS